MKKYWPLFLLGIFFSLQSISFSAPGDRVAYTTRPMHDRLSSSIHSKFSTAMRLATYSSNGRMSKEDFTKVQSLSKLRIAIWSDLHHGYPDPGGQPLAGTPSMDAGVADILANVPVDVLFSGGDNSDHSFATMTSFATWRRTNVTGNGIIFRSAEGNHDSKQYENQNEFVDGVPGNWYSEPGDAFRPLPYYGSVLASGALTGATTLTLESVEGFTTNKTLFITTDNTYAEAFTVASIVGKTITINGPLAADYSAGTRVFQGSDIYTVYDAARDAFGVGNAEFGRTGLSNVFVWQNVVFITLGMETRFDNDDYTLSDRALDWLEEQLSIYAGHNIIVISHVPFTDNGLVPNVPLGPLYYDKNSARVKSICAANKITAWFTGHTHSDPNNTLGDTVMSAIPEGFGGTHFIAIPAISRKTVGITYEQSAAWWLYAEAEIGDTAITVRTRNSTNQSWLADNDITLNLTYPIEPHDAYNGSHRHDNKQILDLIGGETDNILRYPYAMVVGSETNPYTTKFVGTASTLYERHKNDSSTGSINSFALSAKTTLTMGDTFGPAFSFFANDKEMAKFAGVRTGGSDLEGKMIFKPAHLGVTNYPVAPFALLYDRVGILNESPTVELDVNGDILADNLEVTGTGITFPDSSVQTVASPLGPSSGNLGRIVIANTDNKYIETSNATFSGAGYGNLNAKDIILTGTPSFLVNDFTTGGTLVAAAAETVKTLNTTVSGINTRIPAPGAAGYVPFGASTSAYTTSANLYFSDSNIRLGIGTTSPLDKLHLEGTTDRARFLTNGYIKPYTAGTSLASPTIVSNGTFVGAVQPFFYDGSTYRNPAFTVFVTNGTMAAGSIPTDWYVATGSASASEKLRVASSGLITYSNSAGVPHGSAYGNEIAWSQASAVQNTWYAINDTDMTDGQLLNVTHDGSGKLTMPTAGRYLINYAVTLTSATGQHIQTGILKTGAAVSDCIQHIDITGASTEVTVSSTCILSLAANDTVQIAMRATDAGTPTLNVDHVNLTAYMVGAP